MKTKVAPSDHWKEFEGIPLCHVPTSKADWEELERKGSCRCG
jgi:hypothetical protein